MSLKCVGRKCLVSCDDSQCKMETGVKIVPLQVQNMDGSFPLHYAIENRSLKCAHYLIELGVDVDAADFLGNTALHHAVKDKFVSGVELLLKSKANPNVFNSNGDTPAQLASKLKNYDMDSLFHTDK